MPIYEYSCDKCGNVVERIQKFSDPLLTEHEGCGGPLTKLISRSAFHLKGDGWYVTDYARKDKNEADKDDKKDATKTVAKESEGVTDSSSGDKTSKDTVSSSDKSGSKKESSSTTSDTKPAGGTGS